jgi:hypothetical protein
VNGVVEHPKALRIVRVHLLNSGEVRVDVAPEGPWGHLAHTFASHLEATPYASSLAAEHFWPVAVLEPGKPPQFLVWTPSSPDSGGEAA